METKEEARLEKAMTAKGEDELQRMVLQFKQASSEEVGEGILTPIAASKNSKD